MIGRSYRRAFRWDEALSGGLRRPQYGALLAVLAYWTRDRAEPATVVMPTGAGKTDTMVALFVAGQIPRLMVIVPDRPVA
jgi:superfamily II DNA or RNA helicase